MGKRKHQEIAVIEIKDEVFDVKEEIEEVIHELPVKKKRLSHQPFIENGDDDEYDVWLVCKAKSVSNSVLDAIKFPRHVKDKHLYVEFEEDGNSEACECDFRPVQNQAVILQKSKKKLSKGEASEFCVKDNIDGVVYITPADEVFLDFPLPPEDDYSTLKK
uniref:DUF1681 domain-containing protein n=1 Tax=Parastrongyloides trichosuri TaxID=131310 RepID=A0A0N4ZGI5_PARTI